jgi:DNA polymerase III epsilon subunit-like protein
MIVLLFDTETTDLINNRSVKLEQQPEILSLFYQVVDIDNGTVLKKESYLFKPSKPIREEITKINGISDATVANAPKFRELANIIKAEIEQEDAVIAHNLAFDKDMIEIEFERLGEVVKWPRLLCTVEQTMFLKGYRLSLTNLYKELFHEDFEEKHSAEGDVAALTRVCVEMRKRNWL